MSSSPSLFAPDQALSALGHNAPSPDSQSHPPRGDAALEARHLVARLGDQIRGIQSSIRRTGPVISSGSVALDRCMPHGGFLGGTILELTTPHGLPVGATSIALNIAKHAVEPEQESGDGTTNQRTPMAGKYVVVIEPPAPYYPPALEHLGLPLERVIGLRPSNLADLLWSMDQALRCPAVGCVIAHIDRLDDRAARRLQLATEIGGGLAILVRPAIDVRCERSWADVQWYVASEPPASKTQTTSTDQTLSAVMPTMLSPTRWFRMTLKRCHGGRAGAKVRIGIGAQGEWVESNGREVGNAKTNHVHLAAELAKPTRIRREAAG
ncbi:MAG: ImuA family protein [Pirellula sp.]|jgi:protein ImuA